MKFEHQISEGTYHPHYYHYVAMKICTTAN